MPTIRILLLEDNRLSGEGAVALLNEQTGFKARFIGTSRTDLLSKVSQFKPHVVMLRAAPEIEYDLKVVSSLKSELPQAALIAMGLEESNTDISRYVAAGISGFIADDALLPQVIQTIRAVAQGKTVLPLRMAGPNLKHVIAQVLLNEGGVRRKDKAPVTAREQEIVDQIFAGRSNAQIAKELNIAIHTVKSHVHNVLEKMGLDSRTQIAVHASRQSEMGQARHREDSSPEDSSSESLEKSLSKSK